jgi:hypothetical protein
MMSLLPVQVTLVVIGLLFTALLPPAKGNMRLIPITHQNANTAIHLAVANGARLVATSASQTVIVYGERTRLGWTMLRSGILPLGSFGGGCSESTKNGR